jgi:hypothetical protein
MVCDNGLRLATFDSPGFKSIAHGLAARLGVRLGRNSVKKLLLKRCYLILKNLLINTASVSSVSRQPNF